jgi:tyrosinase
MSSMGGNGAKVNYPGVPTMGFQKPYDMIPADMGGGCVTDGPFKKYVFLVSILRMHTDSALV